MFIFSGNSDEESGRKRRLWPGNIHERTKFLSAVINWAPGSNFSLVKFDTMSNNNFYFWLSNHKNLIIEKCLVTKSGFYSTVLIFLSNIQFYINAFIYIVKTLCFDAGLALFVVADPYLMLCLLSLRSQPNFEYVEAKLQSLSV